MRSLRSFVFILCLFLADLHNVWAGPGKIEILPPRGDTFTHGFASCPVCGTHWDLPGPLTYDEPLPPPLHYDEPVHQQLNNIIPLQPRLKPTNPGR